MAPVTRRSATNKAKGNAEPARQVLKIRLTPGQVQTAFPLSVVEEQRAAIEKAAAIESKLRQAKEAELQAALTRPMASRRASAAMSLGPISSDATDKRDPSDSAMEEEEVGGSKEGTPLFLNDVIEDRFSPATGEQDSWDDEPEWTGFSNNETMPMSEDDSVEPTEGPPWIATKPAGRVTAKPKKAPLIRDLVKTQMHNTHQPNPLESKKRRLVEDDNRPAVKRIISKSKIETGGDFLTIRSGFLEEDDADTIQHERKAIKGKGKKASKSIVKVTHETAPPTAEEKRKKSNIASCYLKEFDATFVPELIKHVSEDTNPWQPTFDADSVISGIRRRVYSNITEAFEGRDPLAAPAFNKVTNWRAAIGRRAIAVAKTYFGDKTTFEMACDIEEHVAWLLPSKDVDEDEGMDVEEIEEEEPSIEEIVRRRKREFVGAPFLWGNGSIGTREKEPPYGYLLNPLILETFAIHFETTGINMDPIGCKTMPVGALALTLAAVERAIGCWETGEEKPPTPFSQVECGNVTQDYVDALVQVSRGRWEQVLTSTRDYTSYRKQDALKQKQKKSSIRAQVPAGPYDRAFNIRDSVARQLSVNSTPP